MTVCNEKPKTIREQKEAWEIEHLAPGAAKSSESKGRRYQGGTPCPVRTCFERDKGRIIYSMPFRRLRQKTQVFFNPRNDHVCTRMEHVIMVNYIARIIGSALHLNGDLIEAIALGHDLGHAPFGHSGESALSELVANGTNGEIIFSHELHSLRIVDLLAERGHKRGLNLSFEVRDGIVSHCGENYKEHTLNPNRHKGETELHQDQRHNMPCTLEGCIVRISDRIAYVGRDIEDATRAGIFSFASMSDEMKKHLGETNAEIVNSLVTDIVETSTGKDYIALSDTRGKLLEQLLQANMDQIYKSPKLKRFENQVNNIIEGIFEALLEAIAKPDTLLNHSEAVLRDFGIWLNHHPEPNASKYQKLVDYIAGMTDHYATQVYEALYLV